MGMKLLQRFAVSLERIGVFRSPAAPLLFVLLWNLAAVLHVNAWEDGDVR